MKYGQDIIANVQTGTTTPATPVAKTFQIKTANQVLKEAANRPVPKQLFGPLWFEGEMCIFFASSNVGKSILAVQIGESIARGRAIAPFSQIEHPGPRKVLYFDFELSDKQFENRYSEKYQNHYVFSDTFYRASMSKDYEASSAEEMERDIAQGLEDAIVETQAKIVIVDNITWLKSDASGGKDAVALMRIFNGLKRKYGLSFLVLGHTPKRDLTRPLTQNDLQGSAALMQFCDSSFAAGISMISPDARYLKQIKVRETSFDYGEDNTLTWRIDKMKNFLCFDFQGFEHEREHLYVPTTLDDETLKVSIEATIERQPNWSLRQVAESLSTPQRKVNHMKVKRLLEIIERERAGQRAAETENVETLIEDLAKQGFTPLEAKYPVKEEDIPF